MTKSIIITQDIETAWSPANYRHLKTQGYDFQKFGTPITIPINHLSKTSPLLVEVECPECKNRRKIQYRRAIKKTICHKCTLTKKNFIDRKGQRYDRLTVIENVGKSKGRCTLWLCDCECGNSTVVRSDQLIAKISPTRSCGCYRQDIFDRQKGKNHPMYGVRGKDNPNWDDSIPIHKRITKRNYPEYKEWRQKVFRRDNYTCQVCNIRGYKLHAHHKYNYSSYPHKRTMVDNGITLCESCHICFHKFYGSSDNNPKQLREFVASM